MKMKWFQNLSFKGKIALGFFTAGFLPLLFCILVLNLGIKSIIKTDDPQKIQSEFSILSDVFSNYIDSIDLFLIELKFNKELGEFLLNPETQHPVFLFDIESERVFPISDFTIYDKAGNCLYASSSKYYFSGYSQKSLNPKWGILRSARNSSRVVWQLNSKNNGFDAAIAVKSENNIIGFAMISVIDSNIDTVFHEKYSNFAQIFVADKFWHCIYSSFNSDDIVTQFRNMFFDGKSVFKETANDIYFVDSHRKSGFYVLLKQQKTVTDSTRIFLLRIVIVSLIVSVIFYTLFADVLSRQFFEPIQKLNNAMILVEKGNLEIELKTKRIDELGQLIGRFNRTVKKLKQYMGEILNRQKELNNTQIRMMQAQLNPHFLYNTLDTVKWIAKINKINTVAIIATNLADILRLSISRSEFIPLEKELNMLDQYIEIQKIRFPDKFELEVNVEHGLEEFNVPKLMLQPLIENSILHGFSEMKKGIIKVTAEKIGDEVVINVIDNGSGISKEAVNMIQSHTGLEKGHLGLYNVDAILRLHYGDNYGLRSIPMQQRGTCIRIILPM